MILNFSGGEDYEPMVQLVLTFNADSENMQFIDIVFLSDNTTEEIETFSLLATSSDPSVSFTVNETVIFIIDNDSKNQYSLTLTSVYSIYLVQFSL